MWISKQINASVTVKQIFQKCWSDYKKTHTVTDYQEKEVEKALSCYDKEKGCFLYSCEDCGKLILMSYGCNSRICSCCGKLYADQWSHSLSKSMFPVPHRHFVMSVPDRLWSMLRYWNLLKNYMDCAIACFNEFFSKMTHRKLKVGVIVFLHPFGKDVKFQPHLHILLTEGGFDPKKQFVPCKYIPALSFKKKWQYEFLKMLHPKGFYVWLHKRGRIHHPRLIAKYVGRYVRHPAIANSRIFYFDGKMVKFFYINHDDKRVNVVIQVDQFISALIQHIPPKQFKMIRYYGAYARNRKRLYGGKVQSSIKQLKLTHFGAEKITKCPDCGGRLRFFMYLKKEPPDPQKYLWMYEKTQSNC